MQPIVVVGETKPGDLMERPFVAVSFATWQETEAASRKVAELTTALENERALTARITQEFQDYMREHQMLHTQQQKAGS